MSSPISALRCGCSVVSRCSRLSLHSRLQWASGRTRRFLLCSIRSFCGHCPLLRPNSWCSCRSMGTFNGNTWGDGSEMSYPMYQDIRDRNAVFSGVCARFEPGDAPVGGRRHGTSEWRARVRDLFSSAGHGPAHGRVIAPTDDRVPGGHSVAVLSFDYWTSRFNGDPRIVGQKILLNGQPFAIVGVSRPGISRCRYRVRDAGVRPDDDEGAADARLELPGRPTEPVRAGICAAPARGDRRACPGGTTAVLPGDAGGGDQGFILHHRVPVREARVHECVAEGCACGTRPLGSSRLRDPSAVDADGDRGRGAPDCLRQRCRAADRARHGTPAGDCDSDGARGRSAESRPAASGREPRPVADRRRWRSAARHMGHEHSPRIFCRRSDRQRERSPARRTRGSSGSRWGSPW